jgi:hypothetical protein
MNYLKIYNKIIDNAKKRNMLDCYMEKHHIIPKSEGGSNENNNLVYLTPKEHFIAHKLLYRIDPKNYNRMLSFLMMSNRFNIKWGNIYEEARVNFSNNHHYKTERIKKIMAKPKTEEHKKKISDAHRGKPKSKQHIENMIASLPNRSGENNSNFGKGKAIIVDGIEYKNLKTAAIMLNKNVSYIHYRLKNKKYTNFNYKSN